MKNLTKLYTVEDRENFLLSLWSTPEFKNSFTSKGYVWEKVKRFLNHPRMTALPSNLEIEHSHFYSWFNVLILKNYDNKYVQDLYFLHELNHIVSMPYASNLSFNDWSYKMNMNEIESSLESEVMVYNHLNIREKTFTFKIWADTLDKNLTKNQIFFERMRALMAPKNEIETRISNYLWQDQAWFELWEKDYEKVESNLKAFYKNGDLDQLEAWLLSVSENEVPFYQNAVDFAKVYHSTNTVLFKTK